MKNLKALREKRNLTQEQVAAELNVSRIAVVYWEQGKQNPRTKHLRKLANLLQCTVDDLL